MKWYQYSMRRICLFVSLSQAQGSGYSPTDLEHDACRPGRRSCGSLYFCHASSRSRCSQHIPAECSFVLEILNEQECVGSMASTVPIWAVLLVISEQGNTFTQNWAVNAGALMKLPWCQWLYKC